VTSDGGAASALRAPERSRWKRRACAPGGRVRVGFEAGQVGDPRTPAADRRPEPSDPGRLPEARPPRVRAVRVGLAARRSRSRLRPRRCDPSRIFASSSGARPRRNLRRRSPRTTRPRSGTPQTRGGSRCLQPWAEAARAPPPPASKPSPGRGATRSPAPPRHRHRGGRAASCAKASRPTCEPGDELILRMGMKKTDRCASAKAFVPLRGLLALQHRPTLPPRRELGSKRLQRGGQRRFREP